MKRVEPDFYSRFRCIASQCCHSCCKGWEIDIDSDTAEYYSHIPGELGTRLQKNIDGDGTPHFILTEKESCPFLQKDGLCELILKLGEDALCDICTEHPRFYNYIADREEAGLGLCCEEVVRLLLEGDGPLSFTVTDDGEDRGETDDPTLAERQEVFDILSRQDIPLYWRMKMTAEAVGLSLPAIDLGEYARLMRTLEIMNSEWESYLDALEKRREPDILTIDGIKWERLAEYFIYRHFVNGDAGINLLFALVSTEIIYALTLCGFPIEECVRLYSSEIEYAEENMCAVKEKIMLDMK